MTHDNTEKISLWLDNELSQAEVAQLQAHLAQCPACTQIYQAMQQVDSLLRCAAVAMAEPQPGFSTRFEARLAQQPQVKRWRMWAGLGVLLMGVLLLAALLLVVTGITVVGANPTSWLYLQTLSWLGSLGQVVNQTRACVNLGGAFFRAIVLTMQQPLFWGFVAVAVTFTGMWAGLLQMAYRRTPITAQLFI
jgi:predicted anti-sigma-YlaC factor YlaD